jgi:4-hydroxy-tetrahydrodipicolinate synthase
MYLHFSELARVGPLIMYNIQGRTGVNMTAATTLRVAGEPNVLGVKEASGDIDQMGLVCAGAPQGFRVWSGDDSFTLPLLAVGGHGVICVVSHLAGRAMKDMIEAHLEGQNDVARDIHQRLLPVIKALMTTASNPIPLKSVLNALGFPAGPFRLPLAPLPEADLERVMEVVRSAGDLITTARGSGTVAGAPTR